MKVQIGQAVKGGKPHMIVGTTSCPVAALKPLITTLKPSEVNPADVCFWCRRSPNLEAASRANCYGNGWSQALDRLLADIEPVYTVAEQRALSAEIAAFPVYASSGFSGAVFTPKPVVEVEPDLLSLIPSRPKSAFAEAVERMGVRSPKPSIRRSKATRRNVNIHARFATKAA